MRKRMFLSLTMIFLVAALIGGATFAVFTDESTNADNTFAAGTIDINSAFTTAWSGDCELMAPGDVREAKITVTNSGSLELGYDIAATLSGKLFTAQPNDPNCAVLEIFDAGGNEIVPGPDNNRVLASGASEVLTVKVRLPLDAGNAYQGAQGSVTLTFNAVQTANNPDYAN